jgi:EAL domain-containing protein (putative c-di-GMP-specific phosphodiesterase class I)
VIVTARHESPEAVLADAETAMQRAAVGTGTQFAFSDGSLWSDLVDTLAGLDLRDHSDAVGFGLDYQPIVAVADRSLWGMEALLRWEDAESPRRSALDLVHVAEQTGWIEPLGRWVMREATTQAHGWTPTGASNVMIFVNVSATLMSSARFVEDVDETLRITGLAPTRLGLDIPTSVLSDTRILDVIRALRSRGVTIALDDLEVRAHAIRSLEEVPVDMVKLDTTAADALGSDSARSLLAGIVSWAHQLDLTVTAKNIETQYDLTLAVEAGFDHLQGLLISPPLHTPTLDEFIIAASP